MGTVDFSKGVFGFVERAAARHRLLECRRRGEAEGARRPGAEGHSRGGARARPDPPFCPFFVDMFFSECWLLLHLLNRFGFVADGGLSSHRLVRPSAYCLLSGGLAGLGYLLIGREGGGFAALVFTQRKASHHIITAGKESAMVCKTEEKEDGIFLLSSKLIDEVARNPFRNKQD